MKTLVDAAANALKMAEKIRAKQGDGASREKIVEDVPRRGASRMLSMVCARLGQPRSRCCRSG